MFFTFSTAVNMYSLNEKGFEKKKWSSKAILEMSFLRYMNVLSK